MTREMLTREVLTGFAVDFGGTKATAAQIQSGEIVTKVTGPTNRSGNLEMQLDEIHALLLRAGYVKGAKLGVAVTGLVSGRGVWSAVNTATLPAIRNAPLLQALQGRYAQVACCNDGVATAIAEARFGAGHGCRDFVYLTVSTGVGGGLILNGQPVIGMRGMAGHFGFATTAVEQHPCGSGRMGTVESAASGLSLARKAAQMGHPDLTAKDIFQMAASGAGWADRLIESSARIMAGLAADLVAIVDPEKVAIGGSIGLAPGYLDRVTRHLASEPGMFQCSVIPAQLGHDGPLLGALANLGH